MGSAGREQRLGRREMPIHRRALDASAFGNREDAGARRTERGVKIDGGLDNPLPRFVLPLGASFQKEEVLELIPSLTAEGQSLRDIAAELTASGLPTKEGHTQWTHSTIRGILGRAA